MNILKAFSLTFLSIVVYYIPQAILVFLVKKTDWNIDLFNPNLELLWSLSSVIAYLLVFYLFWRPKPHYSNILDINGIDFKLFPYLLIIAIGYGFVGQPFWDYNRLMDYFQSSNFEPSPRAFHGFFLEYAYRCIKMLIIAPIFEELFFRKFLFSKLLEKYKFNIAIIISSLCFSAIHFETPSNLIPSLIFGLISALIYFKTKKISYSICLHFIINLSTILSNTHGETYYGWLDGLKYDLVYWALFVFGILITVLGVKKITTANNTYNS